MADSHRGVRTPLWRTTTTAVTHPPEHSLTLEEVAAQTGLRAATIRTAMYSTLHGPRSLLRQIARPAYNVQGAPYWDPKQVKDYFEQIQTRFNIREEFAHLPTVDRRGAEEIQATSLHGLSRLTTVPLTTLFRWKLAEKWPRPAAIMEVDSPTPQLLYSWPHVREHIKDKHANWLKHHPGVNLDDPNLRVTQFL